MTGRFFPGGEDEQCPIPAEEWLPCAAYARVLLGGTVAEGDAPSLDLDAVIALVWLVARARQRALPVDDDDYAANLLCALATVARGGGPLWAITRALEARQESGQLALPAVGALAMPPPADA